MIARPGKNGHHQLPERDERQGVRQDVAPGRRRRVDAEAEEADERLGDDVAGDDQRGGDDDRAEGVGQDVAEDDPPVARRRRPCAASTNSRSRIDRKRLRTRRLMPIQLKSPKITMISSGDPAAAEEPGDDEDHEQDRQAEHHVHDAHQHVVDEAAEIARRCEPTIVPMMTPMSMLAEADEQRRPGAVHDERQDVALEAAGLAERVGERGTAARARRARPGAGIVGRSDTAGRSAR